MIQARGHQRAVTHRLGPSELESPEQHRLRSPELGPLDLLRMISPEHHHQNQAHQRNGIRDCWKSFWDHGTIS